MPAPESCSISAESEPPTSMTEITASVPEVEMTENASTEVLFNVTWHPPSLANGVLLEYELSVGTSAIEPAQILYHAVYPVSQLQHDVHNVHNFFILYGSI